MLRKPNRGAVPRTRDSDAEGDAEFFERQAEMWEAYRGMAKGL